MKIGDVVSITVLASSILDCCAGKRGRIAHIGVGGGFLVCTDHFCPIERSEEELTVVPVTVLAEERLTSLRGGVREEYENSTTETLHDYADTDLTARAVLILRGEGEGLRL